MKKLMISAAAVLAAAPAFAQEADPFVSSVGLAFLPMMIVGTIATVVVVAAATSGTD
ncbi:hypothetical protein [Tropicibacter naphthalenivorans]|uniref:Uncharacterized protein n=1 Tax=Tropicibacter naphthalenivorans TaxID=441103 RepID=A0A0P1GEQ1_9RHOB|nr:hypothetical protein [Tropicibacter naphthalenivorans]CUH79741.1 hypothetical protein TRN7648_02624 [Tropicibacter naphthalenivorans]SMC74880.1 hypothetical protein SAMN04488093_103253 [Tropicibacter naphthalenivorans]